MNDRSGCVLSNVSTGNISCVRGVSGETEGEMRVEAVSKLDWLCCIESHAQPSNHSGETKPGCTGKGRVRFLFNGQLI